MNVGCARGVVAGEDGGELGYAVVLGGLETTEEGGVDVEKVGRVTVAVCDYAGVNASGVAVPEVDHGVDDWVAGVYVNYLDVHDEFDTLLGLN